MCFDTISINTVSQKEVSVSIKTEEFSQETTIAPLFLKKQLLNVASQHHTSEFVLEVFS